MLDPLELPTIRKWAEGFEKPVSVLDVVNAHGLDLAIAYSRLFFPEFVEVGGFVVLAEGLDRAACEKWAAVQSGGPVAWDNVHVYDFFLNERQAPEERVWLCLADLVQRSWSDTIRYRFPGREVLVALSAADHDYGPTISIYQVRQRINMRA